MSQHQDEVTKQQIESHQARIIFDYREKRKCEL